MTSGQGVLRIAMVAGLLLLASLPALGQEWRESHDQAARAGKKFWQSEPVHNPETGSYYQLVRDQTGPNQRFGLNWDEAAAKARTLTYKGRQGGLAVITSADEHEWLLRQWELSGLPYGGHAWIGLRYWCTYRSMTWENGEEHPFNEFSAWDTPWYREDGIRCSTTAIPWMGIYINAATGRWRATGLKKAYNYFIVEYPPEEDVAANDRGS